MRRKAACVAKSLLGSTFLGCFIFIALLGLLQEHLLSSLSELAAQKNLLIGLLHM